MNIIIHRIIGCVLHVTAPGYSHCMRCLWPWKYVDGHSTMIDHNTGMFPLCQECWGQLTPEQRVPYYLALYRSWTLRGAGISFDMIREAVLREEEKAPIVIKGKVPDVFGKVES